MKRFLMTTVFVAATALPLGYGVAYADDTTPQAPASGVTPAPADQNNAPAETQQPAMPSPSAQQSPAPDSNAAPSPTAETQTPPPPSDAIIAAQGSTDIRADKIIGMKVYNPDGHEVGKVKDVLFDANGNVKGVVLSVGGVLGIGAKPVGLQWKELDVQPTNDIVKVNYTKEQLEAAPSFQTMETSAGAVDNQLPAPSPSGSAPAPTTAPAQQ